MNTLLIDKVKRHCKSLMKNSICNTLPFHNWQHTKEVVQNSERIASGENLSEEETENIIIAAYFHDTGNSMCFKDHEAESCKYAEGFLEKQNCPEYKIQDIIAIIAATKMPQNPSSLPQKVICDADLGHLGEPNFMMKNKLLRKEWGLFNNVEFSDIQWKKLNIRFLKTHEFFTGYAKCFLSEEKANNLRRLGA